MELLRLQPLPTQPVTSFATSSNAATEVQNTKDGAAAMVAKLAASTSSAQMLSSILSTLVAEEASSKTLPPEKKQKHNNLMPTDLTNPYFGSAPLPFPRSICKHLLEYILVFQAHLQCLPRLSTMGRPGNLQTLPHPPPPPPPLPAMTRSGNVHAAVPPPPPVPPPLQQLPTSSSGFYAVPGNGNGFYGQQQQQPPQLQSVPPATRQ